MKIHYGIGSRGARARPDEPALPPIAFANDSSHRNRNANDSAKLNHSLFSVATSAVPNASPAARQFSSLMKFFKAIVTHPPPRNPRAPAIQAGIRNAPNYFPRRKKEGGGARSISRSRAVGEFAIPARRPGPGDTHRQSGAFSNFMKFQPERRARRPSPRGR